MEHHTFQSLSADHKSESDLIHCVCHITRSVKGDPPVQHMCMQTVEEGCQSRQQQMCQGCLWKQLVFPQEALEPELLAAPEIWQLLQEAIEQQVPGSKC